MGTPADLQEVGAKLKQTKASQYQRGQSFFQKSLKKAMKEALFLPITLGEIQNVRLKPRFNTACWSFKPPHSIFIGLDILKNEHVRKGLTDEQLEAYLGSFYYHELAHAFYTERNLQKLNDRLELINCSFSLYNLFEDGYIEHRFRKEAQCQFNWLDYEEFTVNPVPTSILFGFIQAEGDAKRVWQQLTQSADFNAETEALFKQVALFYRRIIAVVSSWDLFPVLQDWIALFGCPQEPNGRGAQSSYQGMAELGISYMLQTSPENASDFEADTMDMDAQVATDEDEFADYTADENHEAVSSCGVVLPSTPNDIFLDTPRAMRLAKKFEKILSAKERRESTATPQKRISPKNAALGRPPFVRKELKAPKKRKIGVVVDCSGSMCHHMAEACILLMALSMLAKRGLIEGHVIFSAIVDGDLPRWETYSLPLSKSVLEHVQGYAGGEGLEYALRGNMNLLKKADHVLVYTDGNIGDAPVRKSYLHQQGIQTWGLYVGNVRYLDKLMMHFDKALIRDSIEEIVDAILLQLPK